MPVLPRQPEIQPDAVPAQKILAMVKELQTKAQRLPPHARHAAEFDDPDHVVIERRIPLKMSKWRTMPPGVKGDGE
jgi:hypothetical protein